MGGIFSKALRTRQQGIRRATQRARRRGRGRTRYLSGEEAAALVAACSDELRPLVVAALHTGMRYGELVALDWDAVDLARRLITVLDSKNHDSRIVPVNDVLYNALAALPKREGAVFLTRVGGGQHNTHTQTRNAKTP
jgi:integrase